MSHTNNKNGRTWLGIILIIIGGLIFLRNFHFDFMYINLFSWPVILLFIGIFFLFTHKNSFLGIILIAVGGTGIASKYLHISFRSVLSEYWPFLIIAFGIYLIFKHTGDTRRNNFDYLESEEVFLDTFSIFGDHTKRVKTNNFLGGKVTSLFSDLKIDLRDSALSKPNVELDTLTMFGATEIFIPQNWNVVIKTTTIFGGFEDLRRRNDGRASNYFKT